jgi:hypothetical protein
MTRRRIRATTTAADSGGISVLARRSQDRRRVAGRRSALSHPLTNLVSRDRRNEPRPLCSKERHLLVTMTNEPFQPARLYYSVTNQALVKSL